MSASLCTAWQVLQLLLHSIRALSTPSSCRPQAYLHSQHRWIFLGNI